MILRKSENLVYQLPEKWEFPGVEIEGLEWTRIDDEALMAWFNRDKHRQKVFTSFLRRGFLGLVWHNGCEWASYAWMSLPGTLGPPHLPRHIQRLPVYWIFYCRTKEEYQGRGLYKASLSLLAQWARNRDPEASVYIDTAPNNIPSRSAIKAVGFFPQGVITMLTLRVPKLRLIIWWRWDLNTPHPEVARQ